MKAEEVKSLLPDWKGADGCIATNRITVEGYKVAVPGEAGRRLALHRW